MKEPNLIIENLKAILEECTASEHAVSYVNSEDAGTLKAAIEALEKQEQTKEVIPHRNYQYLSDYWCECGWHLGKYNDVKFCPDCGRKINWEKRKYKLPEPYTEEEE